MPRRSIALSEWGIAEGLESAKQQFSKGEILFGKLRPYFHKVGVAAVDGVCSTDIVVVRPKDPSWFGFVLGHASSESFVSFTNSGATGTKMPRTSWKEMSKYLVSLPPESLAASFSQIIRPSIDAILALSHQTRSLEALRDALLPELLSGTLTVAAEPMGD